MSISVKATGKVLEAKTATFKDEEGKDVTYGKVQLLMPDMSGDFFTIQNIKVKAPNFAMISDLAQQKGKKVTLDLEQQSYKGKVSYYLVNPNQAVA